MRAAIHIPPHFGPTAQAPMPDNFSLLNHQIHNLQQAGITDIVLVGPQSSPARSWVKSHWAYLGPTWLAADTSNENDPLNGLAHLIHDLNDDVFWLDGRLWLAPAVYTTIPSYAGQDTLLVTSQPLLEGLPVLVEVDRVTTVGRETGTDQEQFFWSGAVLLGRANASIWQMLLEAAGDSRRWRGGIGNLLECFASRRPLRVLTLASDVAGASCSGPDPELEAPATLATRIVKGNQPTTRSTNMPPLAAPRPRLLFYVDRDLHLPFLKPVHDELKATQNYELAFAVAPWRPSSENNPGTGLPPRDLFELSQEVQLIEHIEHFQPHITVIADALYDRPAFGRIVNVGHGLICKGGFYTGSDLVRRDNSAALMCVPGEWHRQILAQNVFVPIQVTGFIKSDQLFRRQAFFRQSLREQYHLPADTCLMLYAPTFNPELSSIPCLEENIARVVDDQSVMLIKLHTMTDAAWVERYRELARQHRRVVLVEEVDITPSLAAADLLISDVSSVVVEAMGLDIPIIVYENPRQEQYEFYRPEDIEYQVRDACLVVSSLDGLLQAVQQARAHPEFLQQKRQEYARTLNFGRDGKAARRVSQAIVQFLEGHLEPLKRQITFDIWVAFSSGTSPAAAGGTLAEIHRASAGLQYQVYCYGQPFSGTDQPYDARVTWLEASEIDGWGLHRLIRQGRGDFIVLLTPGLNLPPNWLLRMTWYYRWYKDVGLLETFSSRHDYRTILHAAFRESLLSSPPALAAVCLRDLSGYRLRAEFYETLDWVPDGVMLRRNDFEALGIFALPARLTEALPLLSRMLETQGRQAWRALNIFTYPLSAPKTSTAASTASDPTSQAIKTSGPVPEEAASKAPGPTSEAAVASVRTRPSNLVSIIILTHNQLDYTRLCLESIQHYTPEPHEIILVDNGSTDGTPAWLRSQAALQNHYTLIENDTNRGFAAGNNQGLQRARGDCCLLLNNDVVVTPGWLESLLICAHSRSDIGIVGPVSNYVSGPQQLNSVDYNTDNLQGLMPFALKHRRLHAGQIRPFWRVVGFCMLIKQAVIARIGGLDERYGLGNFEDDDFSLRALLAGYRSAIALDSFVHHFGNRTFVGSGMDYYASLLEKWDIFKAKWGLPPELPYGEAHDLSPLLKQRFDPARHCCPLQSER